MMRLEDIEQRQSELLKKVQELFQNAKRTQRDMDGLMDEIRKFEKEKKSLLLNDIFGEGE